ncbi:LamG-like jellyroll fold domain-containing protein [Phaeodactylibacter xiamenensis]|uniref:LamG-like jellyroll fold domain-containing protein n=1 Tax=Phaeodactylibacter xiamenensis TaxID=1524460 RepID=UPI003BA8600A
MLFKKWNPIFIALAMLFVQQAVGQNVALQCDGDDDWLFLPLSSTPLAGNPASFTIEVWFQAQNVSAGTNCGSNFNRLLSLGSPGTRIELGNCGNQLNYFLNIPAQALPVTPLTTITPNAWHHLAVVRTPGQLEVFLDCVSVGTIPVTGNPNIQEFRLGAWPGGATNPAQEWEGLLDDVRLWSTAASPTQLCGRLNCPLSGQEPGLLAYWDFNEAVPGGNNTALTQVTDSSPNGNNGNIYIGGNDPITLTGNTSNFINSTAPLVYPALHDLGLEIRDYPYRSNLLTSICNGDPAHFCLDDNGQTPGPYSNVSVQWEFFDVGGSGWQPVTSPSFIDFCFPVAPGELTLPCSSSPDGFVDRKYRAVSTVTGPTGEQCEYLSAEYDLQICCPISPATVTLSPSGPYCEGETETFTATLNSPDPFVQITGPNVTINWYYVDPIAGTRIPIGSGSSSVTHTVTFPQVPGVTDFCFEVEVTNCNNKMATFSACIPVDPEPVCGTIAGCPLGAPMNLTLVDPNPAHLIYEICPGNDAIICQDAQFDDCIPQWQYTFTDPNIATPSDWVNMGLSNTTQNTNILPSHLWPAGQNSIYYRIQCNPLSNPSGCEPCFSNIVEVTLTQAPAPPTVTGPTQVCVENLPVTLSVNSPVAGLTYTWLYEGLVIGTGNSISALNGGCYWLEASNGCQTLDGPPLCLEVCETIARLSCPLPPNACATPGEPISLTACDSENTCSGTAGLLFEWFVDGVSQGAASSLCDFTHTPATTGTTYKVVVTDPATGCMGMVEQTVIPCDAN